ncbi:SusC/RagA family TonB-linked outer membrane protein [Spirosoma sp. RP8]|uniref:SusC/RagA family TonB-linked outer membrane protein n=1 Tax=Spirosoma liriopis TaxID=2937440 RepID=A0ABT0HLS5_9BACT|nr:SusC/RagA family TonB-linked outer membrane protein [Spirosoma liriopis]MCK8492530.1 SusC/RagA family TonB-linked outer membrane protein [Spirosoma liriopis]
MTSRYSPTSYRIRHIWILWLTLLMCTNTFAQNNRFTLKGRVTDANGAGIPGVTVQVLGTTTGSASDADGNYSFATSLAAGTYTLNFSAVGYSPAKQTITLGNAETVTANATLKEDIANLDEVVVTGSTITTTRRELGNAISTIKGGDLQQAGSAGLLNALQGKVPGAQITQNSGDPSGSISIRLRGIKSLSGSSDPLYVIDGVIVSNQSANVSQLAVADQVASAQPGTNRLADINPNDIASLNVINGAAAAAQYGSRAANGVVLITTKRGSTGAPRVTFSTSFNVNELRKSVPVNLYNKTFGNAQQRLYTINAYNTASAQQDVTKLNPSTTFIPIVRDGTTNNLLSNVVDNVTRYNYFDQIFRTGYGTDNAISVSGGRDNTQYYVSFGYLKNQGIIKGTDFTRYNLRARLDQRLTNWAKLSAGLSYVNSFANEKANGNVFYSPINSVNIVNNIYDITQRDVSGNLQAVEGPRVNPLSTIEDMKFTQSVNRTISDLQLNLTPFKGLSVDYIFGVDTYGQVGQNYIRPYPYAAQASLGANLYPQGFSATGNNTVLQLNSDLNVSYERQLSEQFKLNAVAGYNYQFFRSDYSTSQGQNLAPFIETVRGAGSTTVLADYSLDRFNLSGYFVQATLGYRNLAFLTGAIRRDESSKFSPSVTNQFYPKVSGSFVVSDLGFWKNAQFNDAFNSLKLRLSYGEAGNLSGVGSYSRFYQFSPVAYLGRNTLLPGSQLANPLVRPERMAELEAGADLSFLNNRIGLGVTVYNQQIKDLVVNRVLAPSTGGSSIINNVGTMENKGLEAVLDVVPVKTKDFSWDFTAIFNRNRNKVLSLGSPIISVPSPAGAPYLIQGQPVGVYFGTGYARNADGSLLLTPQGFPQSERASSQVTGSTEYTVARTAEGQPDTRFPTANIVIANPNPKWTGSFATNLNYKSLTLHVLLDFVQGVQVFNADKRTRQGVGLGEYAERELRGELPRGYIFAIYNTEEWRVDNGSYTKLREVSLSYTLPSVIKPISNWSVSLIGRNLYSWDKYPGFDPETNAGGTNDLLRGLDFGNVPIPRTYQVKLSATF